VQRSFRPFLTGVLVGCFSLLGSLVLADDLPSDESIFPGIPLVSELYQSEVEMWSSDWTTGWSASYELGLNGASGNASNFNLSTAFNLTRKLDSRVTNLNFNYAQASNEGILIRDFALLRSRNEYLLGDSPWSIFTEGTVEYDRFQAFDFRLTLATGVGYRFIDNETTTLKTRTGLGTSREFGGVNDQWKPELVLGLDFKHQLTGRQSLYLTNDFYPTWTDFGDFRMITDAGWQLVIDEETRTSLKLGVINRHDSTPGGQEPNDLNYSFLLMWNTK
jgi:putative salt-induced outer membrane protein YdiY